MSVVNADNCQFLARLPGSRAFFAPGSYDPATTLGHSLPTPLVSDRFIGPGLGDQGRAKYTSAGLSLLGFRSSAAVAPLPQCLFGVGLRDKGRSVRIRLRSCTADPVHGAGLNVYVSFSATGAVIRILNVSGVDSPTRGCRTLRLCQRVIPKMEVLNYGAGVLFSGSQG